MNQEQQQQFDDTLKRAGAFEEMIRTEGWKYIQKFYEARVQSLANGMLLLDQPIEKFESERRSIMGMRELIMQVENDLNTLAD